MCLASDNGKPILGGLIIRNIGVSLSKNVKNFLRFPSTLFSSSFMDFSSKIFWSCKKLAWKFSLAHWIDSLLLSTANIFWIFWEELRYCEYKPSPQYNSNTLVLVLVGDKLISSKKFLSISKIFSRPWILFWKKQPEPILILLSKTYSS